MQLLEWSDTRVRFKIRERENNVVSDLDLSDYTAYKLEIKFADESLLEINWVVDDDTVYFDIFGEYTDWREGNLTADIWGINWVKKVRFNPSTIKWKVLNSVVVPNVLQNP
jgi:hypothetical protein